MLSVPTAAGSPQKEPVRMPPRGLLCTGTGIRMLHLEMLIRRGYRDRSHGAQIIRLTGEGVRLQAVHSGPHPSTEGRFNPCCNPGCPAYPFVTWSTMPRVV